MSPALFSSLLPQLPSTTTTTTTPPPALFLFPNKFILNGPAPPTHSPAIDVVKELDGVLPAVPLFFRNARPQRRKKVSPLLSTLTLIITCAMRQNVIITNAITGPKTSKKLKKVKREIFVFWLVEVFVRVQKPSLCLSLSPISFSLSFSLRTRFSPIDSEVKSRD